MEEYKQFAAFAVMYELRSREFRKKLALFPEEFRYYAVLANSIIGAENASRINETPAAVAEDGSSFVARLLETAPPEDPEEFRGVLSTCLLDSIKDELRNCCQNCRNFHRCLDMDEQLIGGLFKKRAEGEDTEALKRELSVLLDGLLKNTPYVESAEAHALCKDFSHQQTVSGIGEVFGRYSDIAVCLRDAFGIDYSEIKSGMILLNMDFCEKNRV